MGSRFNINLSSFTVSPSHPEVMVNLGGNEAGNRDSFEAGGECDCKMVYFSGWQGREGVYSKNATYNSYIDHPS